MAERAIIIRTKVKCGTSTVRWRVSLRESESLQSERGAIWNTTSDAPRAFPLRLRLFSIFHVCGVENVVRRTHAESGRSEIEFLRESLTELPERSADVYFSLTICFITLIHQPGLFC
jgi:hypothetical protein